MTSEYTDIYSRFLLRVKDYELANLDEGLANQMMNGWLKAVLSQPMVRRLFITLMPDDDIEEIEYEMKHPLDEDSDKEFVEEMLCLGMVAQWVSPAYHSTLNTQQFFSNKEQSFYSQANHMAELKAMYEKANHDFRKLIRDRAFNLTIINSDFEL